MTDYESLARRVLGCESRERRGRLWCETHDEPWECPRATEVADELREAWRAEADALLERLSVAERRIKAVRALHVAEDECDCYPGGFSPETYEGPSRWCPMHGEALDGSAASTSPPRSDADAESASEDVPAPPGPSAAFLARAQEWLGCEPDRFYDEALRTCIVHGIRPWPCLQMQALAALLAEVAAEGAADGIEGLMHELACHRDAELAARRADQWRAQARATGADQ